MALLYSALVLCAVIARGSTQLPIRCYSCSSVMPASEAEEPDACSNLDIKTTNITYTECGTLDDDCVYVRAVTPAKDGAPSMQVTVRNCSAGSNFGPKTSIESKGCLNVGSSKHDDIYKMLQKHHHSDKYEKLRYCFCDEGGCDANGVCEDTCLYFKLWAYGLFVVLSMLFVCFCVSCSLMLYRYRRRKKREAAAATSYKTQVDTPNATPASTFK